jgi:GAF domain-containing protein
VPVSSRIAERTWRWLSGTGHSEWALCTHTVLGARPYCLTDNTTDTLHDDNPMLAMTGLHSYAGVPLHGDSGHILGAHCVLDAGPWHFTDDDIAVLTEGAADIMRILDRYRLP